MMDLAFASVSVSCGNPFWFKTCCAYRHTDTCNLAIFVVFMCMCEKLHSNTHMNICLIHTYRCDVAGFGRMMFRPTERVEFPW